MLVKYIGRNNIFTVEYNGKRFCFRKGSEAIDIPIPAYDIIKQSGHTDAQYVIPCEKVDTSMIDKVIEENKKLLSQVKLLTKEISDLTNENKKLSSLIPKEKDKKHGAKKN